MWTKTSKATFLKVSRDRYEIFLAWSCDNTKPLQVVHVITVSNLKS